MAFFVKRRRRWCLLPMLIVAVVTYMYVHIYVNNMGHFGQILTFLQPADTNQANIPVNHVGGVPKHLEKRKYHGEGIQLRKPVNGTLALDDYLEGFGKLDKKLYYAHGSRGPEDIKLEQYSKMSDYWKGVHDGLGKNRQLYQGDFNVEKLLLKMQSNKIVKIDFFRDRPTIKWILTIEGGQKVLFKPELNDKSNKCKTGCEHPAYEVTGFAINRMLGLNSMPFSTGRQIDWFTEIQPVATKDFLQSFNIYATQNNASRVCVKWACSHLAPSVYCFRDGRVRGSVMYWVNRDILELRHYSVYRGRYSRYHPMYFKSKSHLVKIQHLETGDSSFCDIFRQMPPYNDSHNFMYVLDMAVEDFLTQSKNSKHNLLYLTDNSSVNVVIDKGKGFCPYEDDLLLAPVYQCCKIRKTVFDILDEVNKSERFLQTFDELTHIEHGTILVHPDQLKGVANRIPVILKYVENCFKLKGRDSVLIGN